MLIIAVLLGLLGSGSLGSPAGAQEDDGEGDEVEATEFIRGNLVDRKGTSDRDDDEPVPDVEILVTTVDGEEVGTAVSGEDGRFGCVERAAISLADAGAGGGDDRGFAHEGAFRETGMRALASRRVLGERERGGVSDDDERR